MDRHEQRQRERDEAIQAAAARRDAEAERLEGMSKAELAELAEQRGVTVARGDGEDGEPLKSDYIAALKG